MLNGSDILIVNPDVATQDTGEEFVVVLPEQGKYVVLNTTGARIVELADGKLTLTEIAAAIAHSYETSMAQVLPDVLVFSADLVSRGILHVLGSGRI
ncbi:MAG: PqqD family protein [Anaerolineae bacterium]|nr:PqqD family protein [Anaerolineae bacterium]